MAMMPESLAVSTFLGIPHTGHDKTDEWVHKGKHWLEHTADETADDPRRRG